MLNVVAEVSGDAANNETLMHQRRRHPAAVSAIVLSTVCKSAGARAIMRRTALVAACCSRACAS